MFFAFQHICVHVYFVHIYEYTCAQIDSIWILRALQVSRVDPCAHIKRCKASITKFERFPTVLAEWIELKENLAKFQAEGGTEMSDDKGSDDMTPKSERKRK